VFHPACVWFLVFFQVTRCVLDAFAANSAIKTAPNPQSDVLRRINWQIVRFLCGLESWQSDSDIGK